MELQNWRNQLVKELRRRGLPSDRVDRLVEELTDHALDLLSKEMSMDAEQNLEARLGTAEKLAAIAKDEFAKVTFAGRHPLLTFVGGPIAIIIGSFIGMFVLFCLITWLVSLISGSERVQNPIPSHDDAIIAYRICQAVCLIFRFVPFLLSIWIFVRLGNRLRRTTWSFVACGIIALFAFFFRSNATLQTQPDYRVFVDFDLSTFDEWFTIPDFSSRQIIQAVVPLALGACLYWQSVRNQRREHSMQ